VCTVRRLIIAYSICCGVNVTLDITLGLLRANLFNYQLISYNFCFVIRMFYDLL